MSKSHCSIYILSSTDNSLVVYFNAWFYSFKWTSPQYLFNSLKNGKHIFESFYITYTAIFCDIHALTVTLYSAY